MVEQLFRDLMRYIDRMGPQEWIMVLAALIFVGLFCLRGSGSRSKY